MRLTAESPGFSLDSAGDHARRELVFLALGTMDVCVITPLYAAFLAPLTDVRPLPTILALLASVLTIHYVARLTLALPLAFWLRSSLVASGMLVSGLLAIHRVLHAHTPLWNPTWLANTLAGLRQSIMGQEILIFALVVFLWWRGLVLAQRRIDSASVAYRFRLGVILLAVTAGIGGSLVPWPFHRLVFLFFFTSLLGIALARAEQVGHQYGGHRSPFSLGWLATLVTASATVLLMAAGLTSLLAGENLGRILKPVLGVLQILVFAVLVGLTWVAQLLIQPLAAVLRRYGIGRTLQEILDQIEVPQPVDIPDQPREPLFTPEQLATLRVAVTLVGALLLLLIVAISLYRLRAGSGGRSDEERESVWDGAHVRGSLDELVQQGRRRLAALTDALMRSRLGQMMAALNIRRIYAHMAALAAERGYPRAINETPYDYLPALLKAFPESSQDVTRITESYVGVHYGELPERDEDLSAVRSAWHRIQRERSG